MERLTKKSLPPFNYALKDKSDVKVGAFNDYDCFYGHMMAIKRLGEYEDYLEEKGLLLEVPNSTNKLMTASHSEKETLESCISLMHELYGCFGEYLEYIGVNVDELSEDEKPIFNMYMSHIVRTLFLSNTGHSGGTSTGMKCRELGVDYCDAVVFGAEQEEAK